MIKITYTLNFRDSNSLRTLALKLHMMHCIIKNNEYFDLKEYFAYNLKILLFNKYGVKI